MQRLLVGAVVCLFAVGMGQAAILEEKENEWAFELTRVDLDNVGENTELSFLWSWIFGDGHHQIGVIAGYFNLEFDDPLLLDVDGTSLGPVYQFNFTPNNETATGFVFADFQTIGGDAGDAFDSAYAFGGGVKVFVGNSAAIVAAYEFQEFQGASGFQDEDAQVLSVGIAIYTGQR